MTQSTNSSDKTPMIFNHSFLYQIERDAFNQNDINFIWAFLVGSQHLFIHKELNYDNLAAIFAFKLGELQSADKPSLSRSDLLNKFFFPLDQATNQSNFIPIDRSKLIKSYQFDNAPLALPPLSVSLAIPDGTPLNAEWQNYSLSADFYNSLLTQSFDEPLDTNTFIVPDTNSFVVEITQTITSVRAALHNFDPSFNHHLGDDLFPEDMALNSVTMFIKLLRAITWTIPDGIPLNADWQNYSLSADFYNSLLT